jgi:hypothetical protein
MNYQIIELANICLPPLIFSLTLGAVVEEQPRSIGVWLAVVATRRETGAESKVVEGQETHDDDECAQLRHLGKQEKQARPRALGATDRAPVA